jgi:hypothetical protein
VQGGHPHRFRDTLAVELLLDGMPIERVSVLLGNSSVKITERHYAPWVQARQTQLEADLVHAWRNDPIAQAEMLRSETGGNYASVPQMPATYQRHENEKAPTDGDYVGYLVSRAGLEPATTALKVRCSTN